MSFSSCTITGNTAYDVRAHAQKFPSPRWEFLLTCPIDSHLSIGIDIWFYQGNVRASHACKLPNAPMGKLLTRLPRVSLAQLWLVLRWTTASTCRRDLESSHRPDGKIADGLASILACTFAADPPVNYRGYVLQRLETAPSPKSSHRPDGILTCFAHMLAGRRCAHLRWHGELLIVHHHRQHSCLCACSRSKFPIAPMGKMLTRLLRFSLAKLRPTLWSTTDCACRRD